MVTRTRQRIVDAAVELFAGQGYARTTVGQIEAAAGLTPRAGGFYKHFPSKDAVLEVALEQQTEAVDAVVAGLRDSPPGRQSARSCDCSPAWPCTSSMRSAISLRIVMKDGEQFPDLRREFFERFPRRGYAVAQQLAAPRAGRARPRGRGSRGARGRADRRPRALLPDARRCSASRRRAPIASATSTPGCRARSRCCRRSPPRLPKEATA